MFLSSMLLAAGNLCINASKKNGKIQYVSVIVTFLIEVFKLILCTIAILSTKTPIKNHLSFRESFFYAVPSLLYMIDNNLTYIILRFIDPATLSVLWNLKILTTAILFRFVLKRQLSELRKIAIFLLLLGVVTSQSDRTYSTHHNIALASNSTLTIGKNATLKSGNSTQDEHVARDFMVGMVLVSIGVTISSCASVFTEWAFKRKGSCSFLWQNAQLYAFGIFFNSVGLVLENAEIRRQGFFHGFNGWTWMVIFVHSIGGIAIGVMLKYLDNIACVYAHAMAMMLTMFISILFFHFNPSLEFGCGLAVSLVSMYLYHHKFAGGHQDRHSGDTNTPRNKKKYEKLAEKHQELDEMDNVEIRNE
jgi:drug/metabolite transporter (DMT)-like permease